MGVHHIWVTRTHQRLGQGEAGAWVGSVSLASSGGRLWTGAGGEEGL